MTLEPSDGLSVEVVVMVHAMPKSYAIDLRNLRKDLLVFPMNLIWYAGFATHWGGAIVIGLLSAAMMLVLLAGRLLERKDVA
ncbi:MAG TPA: hypothetical protein VE860_21840 [Chthoniobacterales bacterium]|nr:hypothetical protein [Chthoniobacterales bacterium]